MKTRLLILPLAAALALSVAACQQRPAATAEGTPAPAAVETAPAPVASTATPVNAQSGTYELDPMHTIVLASWNHMGFSNPSLNFANGKGQLVFDAQNPAASSVQVTFPLSGITSFTPDFNTHLSSGDFFDVAKFPEATFKSTSVAAAGTNKFTVVGDLTIKGITKPVTLDVTLNGAGEHPMTKAQAIGFDATGTVKRSDWGLDYAAPAVSDQVDLRITTEAQMAAAPAPAAGTAAATGAAAPATTEGPAPVDNAQPVEPEEAAGNPYATPTPSTPAPTNG